jgi:hypothetical protein
LYRTVVFGITFNGDVGAVKSEVYNAEFFTILKLEILPFNPSKNPVCGEAPIYKSLTVVLEATVTVNLRDPFRYTLRLPETLHIAK